jgi:hypothetical protein
MNQSYQMPHSYDNSKPTLVLVNSFTTSSELYRGQYANKELTNKMNLIAIEYECFLQTHDMRSLFIE